MVHFPPILILLQVIAIDVSLAGDNAIAVGIAAAGLPTKERHKAVILGIIAAAILRILFAVFAVQLLQITGLMAAGGLVLFWVAWKMYRDIQSKGGDLKGVKPAKKLSTAIIQIIVADVSMSLDNVLAVAGAARHHPTALVIGLTLSVLLVGAAAAWVARLASKHGWVAWAGIAIVIYTAIRMIIEGGRDLAGVLA